MEDEQILELLEKGYQNGKTYEELTELGLDDYTMSVAKDFYSKKKETTEGSPVAGPLVYESESESATTESPYSDPFAESDAILGGLLDPIEKAYESGKSLDDLKDVSPQVYALAQDYYRMTDAQNAPLSNMEGMTLIWDENPPELGRMWNRAIAGAMLANEYVDATVTGTFDYEKLAYLNNIQRRDAPRDSDVLYEDPVESAVNRATNPAAAFALDVLRTIPESMVSVFGAYKAGLAGAGAGASTGAGVGLLGGPFAEVTVPAAATTGAISGFFGASSLALEYSQSFISVLEEEGVDVTKPDLLREAFKDEQLVAKARKKGLQRGIPIAIFDAISGGIAGKVGTNVVKSVAKSARNRAAKVLAAETLAQGALGGTGEFLGQVISGDEINARDIALEAFAELGPAAPAMAYQLTGNLTKTPGELEYTNWAVMQNQGDLANAVTVAFKADKGKLTALDNEIQSLKKDIRKDPKKKSLLEPRLRELRNEKSLLMKDMAESIMGLQPEARQEAQDLVRKIAEYQKILKDGGNESSSKAFYEKQIQLLGEDLDALLAGKQTKTTTDDTKTGTEEVPGGEQVGQEPGYVPESEAGQRASFVRGILQKYAKGQGKAKLDKEGRDAAAFYGNEYQGIQGDAKRGRQIFEKTKYFDVLNPDQAAFLDEALEKGEFSVRERKELERFVIAAEAFRSMDPNADVTVVFGRGKGGYAKALQDKFGYTAAQALDKASSSRGITSYNITTKKPAMRIAVQLPTKNYERTFNEPMGRRGGKKTRRSEATLYHEIYHNIFSQYFNGNPIDFNQFRKLIVRRLSESDVKALNTFAANYSEENNPSGAGAYRSEEFMVELGALLSTDAVRFEASLLEEIKAFLNNIIGKLTGQRVQIFEDAALAKDLARYMQGTSQAIKTGSSLRDVAMSERLRTERFQRARADVKFEGPDDTAVEVTQATNLKNRDKILELQKKLKALGKAAYEKNEVRRVALENFKKAVDSYLEDQDTITKGKRERLVELASQYIQDLGAREIIKHDPLFSDDARGADFTPDQYKEILEERIAEGEQMLGQTAEELLETIPTEDFIDEVTAMGAEFVAASDELYRLENERIEKSRPLRKELQELEPTVFKKEKDPRIEKAKEAVSTAQKFVTSSPLYKILRYVIKDIVGDKILKSPRGFKRIPKGILKALEISESINVQNINKFDVTLNAISRMAKKFSQAEKDQAATAANDYLFGETQEVRDQGLESLVTISEDFAQAVSNLAMIRKALQESIQNSTVFDQLSKELQQTIKNNTPFYYTRTFRAFTNKNFKFDDKLREVAARELVELSITEEAEKLAKQTIEDAQRYSDLQAEIENIEEQIASGANAEALEKMVGKSLDEMRAERDALVEKVKGLFAIDLTNASDLNFVLEGKVDVAAAKVKVIGNKDLMNNIKSQVEEYLVALEKASKKQRSGIGTGLFKGIRKEGTLTIPAQKLRQRKDLPQGLLDYLGVEKDPFMKLSATMQTLTQMVQTFTLSDKLNEIARGQGIPDFVINPDYVERILNPDNNPSVPDLLDVAAELGIISRGGADFHGVDLMKALNIPEPEGGYFNKNSQFYGSGESIFTDDGRPAQFYRFADGLAQQAAVRMKEYFKENYSVVNEAKSPLRGRAINNEYKDAIQITPLYQSDSKVVQLYFNALLQMRRVRVLYNLPTWRKNIMGGWYFLLANGILPFVSKGRSGVNIMRDLNNRFRKIRKGEVDPVLEATFDKVAELGLLGSSVNLQAMGDINQSYLNQIDGMDANEAWSWVANGYNSLSKKAGRAKARIAYNYGYIDDYTKVIAYLTKRENFAQRLASNPDGRSYAELSLPEQQLVDEMTVERIKQNMPTMSRINPGFRNLFRLPAGDFLSFRVESFRSYFTILVNAVSDINEGVTNKNLTQSQRRAFLQDGMMALGANLALATASKVLYNLIANSLLEDEDEKELADMARGSMYTLPPWMQGANIHAVNMNKDGTVRFVNMSSEDPYDEIQGLIYGRDGISRSRQLINILSDFKDPNLAARLLFNLVEGKDSYGRPIVDNKDLGWINRYIIGPNMTEWSDALGSYVFKETFIPPNMNYIAKEYRKRIKAGEENPDLEVQPLETALALSTALVFRDYPVKIQDQFRYNMRDENFQRKTWKDMSEVERANRKARLDEVRASYEFIVNYGSHFGNPQMISQTSDFVRRTFARSRPEMMYILYGKELPE